MTKGTGILDITRRIVERTIRPGPTILRVGVVLSVAAFAAVTANTNIKAWVASGAAWLTMAGLAERQVGLGIRSVSSAREIASVDWMRRLPRTVWMTALTIETDREATGSRLITLQGRTVAGRARISTICCRVAAVIGIGIIPF